MSEIPTPPSNPFPVLRCAVCGRLDPGPRELCPACFSSDLVPEVVEGGGALVSWTVVRRPPSRFKADGAYAVTVVDLDAGVRITGRLTRLPDERLPPDPAPRLGQRLRFAGAPDGFALFEPAEQT